MDKDDDEPIFGVDYWPIERLGGRTLKVPGVLHDADGNAVMIYDVAPSYFKKLASYIKKREAEQSDALD